MAIDAQSQNTYANPDDYEQEVRKSSNEIVIVQSPEQFRDDGTVEDESLSSNVDSSDSQSVLSSNQMHNMVMK